MFCKLYFICASSMMRRQFFCVDGTRHEKGNKGEGRKTEMMNKNLAYILRNPILKKKAR